MLTNEVDQKPTTSIIPSSMVWRVNFYTKKKESRRKMGVRERQREQGMRKGK